MEPWLDDLAEDLASMSFNSTTSSCSEATFTTASCSSAHGSFSLRSDRQISLADIRFVHRLGAGDIGAVYLAELKCSGDEKCVFAAKVMDKKELANRSKEGRARTEREILGLLGHPFLPTLYASIDSPKWLCLLTEFCPGGDLHVLRQRQPNKRFLEAAVRYAHCALTLSFCLDINFIIMMKMAIIAAIIIKFIIYVESLSLIQYAIFINSFLSFFCAILLPT